MTVPFLDLRAQRRSLAPELDAVIAEVLEEARFIGGPRVDAFESAFAEYLGAPHCVGVGNGTDALEIALEALELERGSEILVPALGFIASSEAVTRTGHRVVFCDCEPDLYTASAQDVARRISPRTAAIMAVHLYGQPCDMAALLALARAHGLKLIEDCAQAHGAEYHGRKLGTFGDVAAFSFYPGKNLGAYGDAGAIITRDGALAQRCRMIANHGRVEKYDHRFEGRNSRLDTLQAAVLSVKLPHLDEWNHRRRRAAERYVHRLAGCGGVVLPRVRAGAQHAHHLFVIQADRRDELQRALRDRGIETGVHYPLALSQLEAYAYLGQGGEELLAHRLSSRVLSLPMGEHLSDGDVDEVAEAVRLFYESARP